MYLPPGYETRTFLDFLRSKAGKMPWPVSSSRTCALAILSGLLLVGCDYRIASEKNVDVCALALDLVTTALQEAPTTIEPRSGACTFQTAQIDFDSRRIEILLLTRSSEAPNDLDRMPRMIMAEAEQAYGSPGLNEFGDLAKLAVAFGSNPSRFLGQVLVSERGVLMQISLGSGTLNRDEMIELTRQLWKRVVEYKPPSS